MSVSLQEELDRAIGDGPEHAPVEHTLRAGRRALRRRRVGAAAGTLAVVAVIGIGYAVAAPGPDGDARGNVATDPSPTAPDPAEPPSEPWQGAELVRYSSEGELQVRPGVTLHGHIENPYGYTAPERSDALDLSFKGNRVWVIIEQTADGVSVSEAAPSNGWAGFETYVADQADGATGGDDGWPDTMRLTPQGTVEATPGATVHNRTDDPQLGDSFAPDGATTGAAVVSVEGDQRSYFVVWRVIDDELDVITTPPADVAGATFAELLSWARSQYASGEGLR